MCLKDKFIQSYQWNRISHKSYEWFVMRIQSKWLKWMQWTIFNEYENWCSMLRLRMINKTEKRRTSWNFQDLLSRFLVDVKTMTCRLFQLLEWERNVVMIVIQSCWHESQRRSEMFWYLNERLFVSIEICEKNRKFD